jgi:hypothetical protein
MTSTMSGIPKQTMVNGTASVSRATLIRIKIKDQVVTGTAFSPYWFICRCGQEMRRGLLRAATPSARGYDLYSAAKVRQSSSGKPRSAPVSPGKEPG